jgi:hypothetical protein
MNVRLLRHTLLGLTAAAALLGSSASHALLFRGYLSLSGNDANPCTLPQPCRLLPAALAAVQDGGEIWMLDSANFNSSPVTVAKSVTILAVPGALGSVIANGGDAIVVNAPGAKVTLRNIVLLNFAAGVNGVNFTQGAGLTMEECEVYGMPGNGVNAQAAGGALNIKNSVIRNNAQYGVKVSGTMTATIDGVHVLTNGANGIGAFGGSKVTVSSSVIANHNSTGSASGVYANASSGLTTQVVVERSLLRANSYAAFAQTTNSGDNVQMSFNFGSMVHNTTGYGAAGVAGSTIAAIFDGNAVVQNTTGVSIGFGTVSTRSNNTFLFNTNNVTGGAMSPVAAL